MKAKWNKQEKDGIVFYISKTLSINLYKHNDLPGDIFSSKEDLFKELYLKTRKGD